MAFQTNDNAASSSNVSTFEKAKGFINIYLPSKDGGQRKLGAIPLRASKVFEKQLLDLIEKEGEVDVMSRLLDKIILNYQSAEVDPAAGFDL